MILNSLKRNNKFISSLKIFTYPKPNQKNLSTISSASAPKYDRLQEKAFLNEKCILVDENDNFIGSSTKEDCHRVNADGGIKLHRAFSVFLFNLKGDMLIQKRSLQKITFPNTYTNTCCSHPLFDIENEREELNAIGIRRAAQRRLNYELGIPLSQVEPESFKFLTRLHYHNIGDGIWGEHEITYILLLQQDVDLKLNLNEVSEVNYVKRNNLDNYIKSLNAPLTPWFKLILQHHLKLWWDNLNELDKVQDTKNINRYTN